MSNPTVPMSLVPFEYGTTTIRTIVRDGEPWFVAADVCAVLALDDVRRAVERIDEADRSQTPIRSRGQNRQMWIVNESGLYDLIIRSDKPEARPFRRWITSEVLPQIRKTGRYGIAELSRSDLARMVLAAEAEREALQTQVAELKPSAAAWDELADTADDYSLREAAQMLCRAGINTGQNRLLKSLRDLKWVDTHGEPYQRQVDAGRLARRTGSYSHPHHGEPKLTVQTRVTPKGIAYLREHLSDGGFSLDLTG